MEDIDDPDSGISQLHFNTLLLQLFFAHLATVDAL